MKLRAFLATVPLAAVALALPDRAEPRYVAVMDHGDRRGDYSGSSFRGWYVDVAMERNAATFFLVEKVSNDDASWVNRGEQRIWCADDWIFAKWFAFMCRAHEEWVARIGPHPALAADIYEMHNHSARQS